MSKSLFELVWVVGLCFSTAGGQQPPTQPQTPAPVQLPPWVLHAKLTHEVMPEYPKAAREQHTEGDAFVDVVVDETGKVQRARFVDCANCSSMLAQAAVEAVRKWEYQPTLVDGKPVQVSSWVAFRFQLKDSPAVDILSKAESSTPAVEPTSIPGPRKFRLSSGVAESNLIRRVEPQYPLEAKWARIQGDVIIQCVIGKKGDITQARVFSGHPLLAPSALNAVKGWKYKPFEFNGEPVEVETVITIKFHM